MIKVFDSRQLAHAPAQELHNGGWAPHADVPSRAESILAAIGNTVPARDFGMAPIRAVHSSEYLDFLAAAHAMWRDAGRQGDAVGYVWPVVGRRPLNFSRVDALLGRFSYDAGTPVTADTWDAAYWGAQTALTALAPLTDGSARSSFALCRPPGHHSGADYLGGYCYLNNAAIAAQAAVDAGAGPVAILDVDYHHGNGTQDIFLERGDVFFASIHADPATDYPFFWGHADERGAGAGEGATLNLPLPRGTDFAAYRGALALALEAIAAFGARTLIVSYGADTFEGDPISYFTIRTQEYAQMAADIAALELPTLVAMEGGYAVDALGANVVGFLSGFD